MRTVECIVTASFGTRAGSMMRARSISRAS
jgi:hypothetical protein